MEEGWVSVDKKQRVGKGYPCEELQNQQEQSITFEIKDSR